MARCDGDANILLQEVHIEASIRLGNCPGFNWSGNTIVLGLLSLSAKKGEIVVGYIKITK